jgi:RNA polymerase sigma-70 factor (ECF subfamily)
VSREVRSIAVADASAQGASPWDSLTQRIQQGDTRAETELVEQFGRGVFVICVARTRDREAARDVTQDVLIAVLRALRAGQLREAGKLPAFVHGITRNLVNDYLRTRARRAESELSAAELVAFDPTRDLERVEQQGLLRRFTDSLTSTDRSILRLALVEGFTLAEVANQLGMSHDAVRARKSRALKKILSELSQK